MTSAELRNRAAQARREHRREDACRDVHEAVKQARVAGDRAEEALSLAALGRLERDDGNLVAAMGHYEEAIAIHLEQHNSLAVAHAIRHLGDIHRENGSPEIAGLCYQEALAIYDADSDAPPLDFANALRSFAIYKQETGDVAGAVWLWRSTREIYAALGIDAGVKECEHRLRDLEETTAAPSPEE
jgi:tetratricopeptide (TPR) repeat protein